VLGGLRRRAARSPSFAPGLLAFARMSTSGVRSRTWIAAWAIAVGAAATLAATDCRSRGAQHAKAAGAATVTGEVVTFPSGPLTLHGVLHKPAGAGPFPALVYNHGSAPGMDSVQVSNALGPVFAAHGWLFLMPFRRGQGLSADAGPYIMDEIHAAYRRDGQPAASATMVRLLTTDHLDDQLAALAWLRASGLAAPNRIAVAGNSFGGIETVLGAERGGYCAAIDSAGGAASWKKAPELQTLMTHAVQNARTPIFFFQAENDHDLTPSRVLSAAMHDAGKPFEMKIYPPYGSSAEQGHTLGYFGADIWSADVFRFLDSNCR
jgi:dipeptidyl aminopeptidase/acylaminoacyl peptidase